MVTKKPGSDSDLLGEQMPHETSLVNAAVRHELKGLPFSLEAPAPDQRIKFLQINVDGTHELAGFAFDPTTQQLGLVDMKGARIPMNVEGVHHAAWRQNKAQWQFLTSIPAERENSSVDIGHALLRFKRIIAVDAAPDRANPNRSFLAAVELIVEPTASGYMYTFQPIVAAECIAPKIHWEHLGWEVALNILSPEISKGQPVAIVTDSSQSELPEFNSRAKEFGPGRLLPESVSLLYAKSDRSPRDTPTQMAIKAADIICGTVLRIIPYTGTAQYTIAETHDQPFLDSLSCEAASLYRIEPALMEDVCKRLGLSMTPITPPP